MTTHLESILKHCCAALVIMSTVRQNRWEQKNETKEKQNQQNIETVTTVVYDEDV